jgi:hypothetical protein
MGSVFSKHPEGSLKKEKFEDLRKKTHPTRIQTMTPEKTSLSPKSKSQKSGSEGESNDNDKKGN